MKHYGGTHFILWWFLFSINLSTSAEACRPKAVYIVRHVEKLIIQGERDPDLSPTGFSHARALDRRLQHIRFDRIIATQFKRTQLTILPIATRNHKKVETSKASAITALATALLASCNQTILVAGHSNTVPQLLRALGLQVEATINGKKLNHTAEINLNEQDYDSLFKVTFSAQGDAEIDIAKF